MVIKTKIETDNKAKKEEVTPEVKALMEGLQAKGEYWSGKYDGVFNPSNTQIGDDKVIALNLLFGIFSELIDIKRAVEARRLLDDK